MTAEVLVIGGGPAGCAAAIRLAKRGHDVVLVEREAAAQHKVCGEFLSREALRYLQALGIDPAALGAVAITNIRLAGSGRVQHAALPFMAMSLTRRTLDEAMLRCAASAGVQVIRNRNVEALDQNNGGWIAALNDEESIGARQVFLATGKHDLRGRARPAGKQSGMLALKMYWRLEPAQAAELDQHVELLAFRGGYAGLQPVEGNVANLCCLLRAEEFQKMGGRWTHLLDAMQKQCPHLDKRLRGAEPLLPRPLAISSIPYGFVREQSDGLWQLGDQAAVIPSFTGDGMSIALHSGMLAAEMFTTGQRSQDFQGTLASQARSQVRFATAISKALVAAPRACTLAANLWPASLQWIAEHTRIPSSNLLA